MKPTDFLAEFVSRRDGFEWRPFARAQGIAEFEMTSQVWRGFAWQHRVLVVFPQESASSAETCVLYVTGGDRNDLDAAEAARISERCGLPVALLFHIPNQPLWERWEDDLIAHTFEQFLDSGDPEWPLLFPMTRAVVRCMDLLESVDGLDFRRFVIMGASKRGWTTWLTACTGDARVAGIAPMVIDNLNFPAQMQHQVESWGSYSEQIEDYTSRELQDEMSSVRGAELVQMMDPINYVDRIKCPILIVNGANDRYWTVDALSLYWHLLPEPKSCLIVPNAGHLLGDKSQMIETVGAFARACSRGERLPRFEAYRSDGVVEGVCEAPADVRAWRAESDSLDFRDSEWRPARLPFSAPGEGHNLAVMLEARISDERGDFSLSTPVLVWQSGLRD